MKTSNFFQRRTHTKVHLFCGKNVGVYASSTPEDNLDRVRWEVRNSHKLDTTFFGGLFSQSRETHFGGKIECFGRKIRCVAAPFFWWNKILIVAPCVYHEFIWLGPLWTFLFWKVAYLQQKLRKTIRYTNNMGEMKKILHIWLRIYIQMVTIWTKYVHGARGLLNRTANADKTYWSNLQQHSENQIKVRQSKHLLNHNTTWQQSFVIIQRMLDTLGKLFINDIRLVIVWSSRQSWDRSFGHIMIWMSSFNFWQVKIDRNPTCCLEKLFSEPFLRKLTFCVIPINSKAALSHHFLSSRLGPKVCHHISIFLHFNCVLKKLWL